uniref:Uncharacterized protein n=1 Tax=Acrobeloides nanus TaxID=290746 RepID=A0A914CD08_9BILA
MEVAIRDDKFDLMGGQCSKLNYGRFQALRPEVDNKWRNSIEKFNTLRYINMILAFAFGVGGFIVSLALFILISKRKELQTGFGVVCFIQVINDVIMFTNVVCLEGASNMN